MRYYHGYPLVSTSNLAIDPIWVYVLASVLVFRDVYMNTHSTSHYYSCSTIRTSVKVTEEFTIGINRIVVIRRVWASTQIIVFILE